MRLAQIARKVNVTPAEVRRYLETEFEINIGKDPNFKLAEEHVTAVVKNFPIPEPEIVAKPKQEVAETISSEDLEITDVIAEVATEEINTEDLIVQEATEISIESTPVELSAEEVVPLEEAGLAVDAVDKEILETAPVDNIAPEENETVQETLSDIAEKTEEVEIVSEEKIIEFTDEEPTDEEGDFTEYEVDPDAALIQAPKVKLDGLKILGKIELPEEVEEVVEEKTEEEIEAEKDAEIAALDAAMQSQAQDVKSRDKIKTKPADNEEEEESEYKDARGFYHFSHIQRSNREKRLIQIEQDRRLIAEKEKKKRHYEQLMREKQAAKSSEKAKKIKEKKTQITREKQAEKVKKEVPKSLWQRFKNWLND